VEAAPLPERWRIRAQIHNHVIHEVFYGEGDSGIMYNDPDIGIEWPFELIGGKENLIISEKDLQLKSGCLSGRG